MDSWWSYLNPLQDPASVGTSAAAGSDAALREYGQQQRRQAFQRADAAAADADRAGNRLSRWYHQTRQVGHRAYGHVARAATWVGGRALGGAGVILGFSIDYQAQQHVDRGRTDLSADERRTRGIVAAAVPAATSFTGGALLAAAAPLCGPAIIVCAGAGALLGSYVGDAAGRAALDTFDVVDRWGARLGRARRD